MESRDAILALLILVVGAGVFYLLDPTMAGLIKRKEGYTSGEFDENSVLPESEYSAPGVNVPTMNHENGEAIVNANNYNSNIGNPSSNPEPNASGAVEGFESLTPAPMPFKDAEKPADCYPKDQINPQELLPNDPNSKWAQVNPMGQGDIAGKNYLSAGSLIGVNTIGQSLRNANYQLRSDPPNPQVKVSIWNQTTIEPDINRRPLEIA
jgi:hypothetical protein